MVNVKLVAILAFSLSGLGRTGAIAAVPPLPDSSGPATFPEYPAVAQGTWTIISPEVGRFSALMPVQIQAQQISVPVLGSFLDWSVYQTTPEDELFAVAYTDLPLTILGQGQTAILEDMSDRFLADQFGWRAALSQSRSVLSDDLIGREFSQVSNGQFFSLRVFLVKRRLYLIVARSSDLSHISQFLESVSFEDIWQPFVSEIGQFQVDLPMAPIVSEETTLYRGRTLRWQKIAARNLYDLADRFVVAYTDIPVSRQQADTNALLQDLATTTMANMGAMDYMQTHHSIRVNNQVGLEYLGTTAEGTPAVMRFFLKGDRFYGTFASGYSASRLNRFLDSFVVQ